MPPRKYPESNDRSAPTIDLAEAKVIDLEVERCKRAADRADTSANNDPDTVTPDGGGAQNEPI